MHLSKVGTLWDSMGVDFDSAKSVKIRFPEECLVPSVRKALGCGQHLYVDEADISLPPMTTLIGVVEGRDVVLCTDGLGVSDDGETRVDNQIKSLKMSDHCALAFAGHSYWIAKVLSGISGNPEWENLSIPELLTLLNERDMPSEALPVDQVFMATRSMVDSAVAKIVNEHDPEDVLLSVFMAGEFQGKPRLYVWNQKNGWQGEIFPKRSDSVRVIEPPQEMTKEDQEEITRILRQDRKSIRGRLRKALEICHKRHPDQCNSQGSYRTLLLGFKLRTIQPRS